MRRDDGFTLIETLMAIAILGVIAFPLGNAVISYLRNTDSTTARLGESHDAQIAAAYLAQDVASVGVRDWTPGHYDPTIDSFPLTQSIETAVAYNGGLYPCGAAGTPNALVRLAHDDFSNGINTTTPPPVISVAYVVETVGSETQLHRISCVDSSAPASDLVLAHYLDPANLPTVSCSSSCGGSGSSVPQLVSISLTIKSPANNGTAYSITLSGQRRQT